MTTLPPAAVKKYKEMAKQILKDLNPPMAAENYLWNQNRPFITIGIMDKIKFNTIEEIKEAVLNNANEWLYKRKAIEGEPV
jgi:hypothetical protein